MDAYLSREAYQALEALILLASRSNPGGLLLGHKRGHRYIVERVFSTPGGFSISPDKYFELDKHFEGKIIGFFMAKPEEKKIKRILAPFAYGKLFLEVNRTSQKKPDLKSFVIDYADKFFLSPIRLKK